MVSMLNSKYATVLDGVRCSRIEIKSYTYDGKTDSKWVGLKINLKINSSCKLGQYSRYEGSAAVPASAVFYLNAFDTIYVSMGGYGKLAGGANFNDIQIEKNN